MRRCIAARLKSSICTGVRAGPLSLFQPSMIGTYIRRWASAKSQNSAPVALGGRHAETAAADTTASTTTAHTPPEAKPGANPRPTRLVRPAAFALASA